MNNTTDAQTVQNDIIDILTRFGTSSAQFIAWCCEYGTSDVASVMPALIAAGWVAISDTKGVDGEDMWMVLI